MSGPVPLGGIDVFHLMEDREMRSRGLAGNLCVYHLELDGRLDPGGLGRRVRRAVELVPELGWRLARGLAPPPRWTSGGVLAPAVRVQEVGSEPLAALVERALLQPLDGERPWSIDLHRGRERDALTFRWFHPLVDAKGAERLLRWLGSGAGDAPEAPPPPEERFGSSERPIAKLDRKARLALMRAYNQHAMELGRTPVLSPATTAAGAVGPATRLVRVHLTAEETRRFDRRVRERARLAETSVMIWIAARVVDRELQARGFAPPRYLVPVPLSIDPKVGSGRMLGNHLSMMMFALDRDDLADEARAIGRLAEQQRGIVRQKLDLGMAAALDFARWLPRPVYRALSTRPFGGREMASFIFSNPGPVAIESFAGLPVLDALPVPAAVLPPGLQIIFTRHGGRLSALLIYVDGVLTPRSAEAMAADLHRELLA